MDEHLYCPKCGMNDCDCFMPEEYKQWIKKSKENNESQMEN